MDNESHPLHLSPFGRTLQDMRVLAQQGDGEGHGQQRFKGVKETSEPLFLTGSRLHRLPRTPRELVQAIRAKAR